MFLLFLSFNIFAAEKTELSSKAIKLKFNGVSYLGYEMLMPEAEDAVNTGKFTIRRNYVQVKAYFKDDPKSYFRTTLDIFGNTKDNDSGHKDIGSFEARLKYAYVYLHEVLPNTGVEIGIVHRPWHDYEQKLSWNYRSVRKIFFEDKNAANLGNSADGGINFKTKTKYVSSEIGIFNGEGYNKANKYDGEFFNNSIEARLTIHALANGNNKVKRTKDSYLNISFNTLNSYKYKGGDKDLNVYMGHFVYNHPLVLVSGQYIQSTYDKGERDGIGYSANLEVRPMKNFTLIGRYDNWDSKDDDHDRNVAIFGLAYKYNKYVTFILNDVMGKYNNKEDKNYNLGMLTTEVSW